jgi:hypothetical protein
MSTPASTLVYIKPTRQIVGVSTAGSSSGQATTVGGTFGFSAATTEQTTTIVADAVVEERGEDELVITDQPVEQGATISDHAYKMPAKLYLTYAWAGGSAQNVTQDPDFLKAIYQQLLGLQVTRTLCQVFTGKRLYQNMLVQAVLMTTDKTTENSLIVRLTMQEILIASTQLVNLSPAAVQALPQSTAPVINQGTLSLQSAPNYNSGATP